MKISSNSTNGSIDANSTSMRGLVYDLPTRLFHWLFAGLFITAFGIAKIVDSESPTYSYHMLAGLTLSLTVLLRVLWGFVGTQHSKFSGFALNPTDLVSYLKGIFTGDQNRWVGHNPASSWSALLMMILALALGFTGYLMTSGPNKEDYEDLHELLANGFLVTVLLHIAGIVVHTIRQKEMIAISMITGEKAHVPPNQVIQSSRAGVAIVFLAILGFFVGNLSKNYNPTTQSLNLFGTLLQLGENENENENKNEGGGEAAEGKEGQGSDEDGDDD